MVTHILFCISQNIYLPPFTDSSYHFCIIRKYKYETKIKQLAIQMQNPKMNICEIDPSKKYLIIRALKNRVLTHLY